MQILFISNYFPPHHFGGYEELCAEVASGLADRGHTVSVLTSRQYKPFFKPEEREKITILRLLELEVPPVPIYASLSFFIDYQRRIAKNFEILKTIIEKNEPQIIFIWGGWNLPRELYNDIENINNAIPVYYFADYWSTLPSAYTLHWQEPGRFRITTKLKNYFASIIPGNFDNNLQLPALKYEHTVCVSNYVLQELINKGVITTGITIHNGIDISSFSLKHIRKTQINRNYPLRLLYAGRIVQEKGIETAINAVSILSKKGFEINLTVLGRGDSKYVNNLKKLSKHLSINNQVFFHAYIHRKKMPMFLKDFDILLSPSNIADSMPRIIQEAMASGLVVIGSNIGGIPEIIQDKYNGLLAPPDDPDAWAERIIYLIDHPKNFKKFAIAGRKTIEEHFTFTKMLDKLEDYFETLL